MQKGFGIPIILIGIFIILLTFILGNLSPKLSLNNFSSQELKKIDPSPSPAGINSIRDINNPILIPYITRDMKLWYQNDYSIYSSSLDGQNQIKVIEGDKFNQLNAVGILKDKNEIFYTTVLEQNKSILFKKNLHTGETEKLLEVQNDGQPSGPYSQNFAISHGGSVVAYTDYEGLWTYSFKDKSKKLILKSSPWKGGKAGGFGYSYPAWSYDDSLIAVLRGLWEGAENVIVNTNGEIKVDNLISGSRMWGYSENQLLIAGYSYGNGGLFLVEDKEVNLLKNYLDFNKPIERATISSSGKIIFRLADTLYLFNTKDKTLKSLVKNLPNVQLDFLWLPDDNYVYINDSAGNVWFVEIIDNTTNGKIKLPIEADGLIATF